jgi:acyl-CoA thioester hydrolase
LHYFHEMWHGEAGYLAATNELMSLHVSQVTRRGAPMPAEVLERLARIGVAHARLATPRQVGRRIGLGAGSA